jgi:hypothetical protein
VIDLVLAIVVAFVSSIAACGVYTGCTGCPSNYGAAALCLFVSLKAL